MLTWPPGLRSSDGIWAKHWYDQVAQSTGFMPYRERTISVAPEYAALLDACLPHYERLYAHRLTAADT